MEWSARLTRGVTCRVGRLAAQNMLLAAWWCAGYAPRDCTDQAGSLIAPISGSSHLWHALGAWPLTAHRSIDARGAWDREAPGPFMRGGHGSRSTRRHDRPTPWADALIDTPRRDALQRRTVHRLELANQTI